MLADKVETAAFHQGGMGFVEVLVDAVCEGGDGLCLLVLLELEGGWVAVVEVEAADGRA